MFAAVVFAGFYCIRSTGTTPVIAHPCYSLKCSIGVVSNEDNSHNVYSSRFCCVFKNVDSPSTHVFDIPVNIPRKITKNRSA